MLTAEADAYCRTTPFEGPTQRCQHADGWSERAVQQLRLLVRAPERERHVGAPFERFDGAVRDLKEPPLDEGGGLVAEIYAHPETKAQSQLIGRLGGRVAAQQLELEQRILVEDARQPNGARRERRDALRTDRIVVRLEPDKRHLPDAAAAREIAVAGDPDADLAVVAGEKGEGAAERREGLAAAGTVFDRDG